VIEQTLSNWMRTSREGDVVIVRYADGTPVQMSNSRDESSLFRIVRSGIWQEADLRARADGLSDLQRRCKTAGRNNDELESASRYGKQLKS
jgi:hypothetical protein